jgi:adenosylmethionine-8-amino-7-oxononanoate aminotransferase
MALTHVTEDRRETAQGAGRASTLWHSQAAMGRVGRAERVIVRGEGAYVWDAEGNQLLDTPASLWYCNVGHGRRELADVAAAQMRRLEAYQTFQQFATPPAIELAERVAALAPIPNAKVFLGSGGSDMIDFAAKLARRTWQIRGRAEKVAIISRENAYHGLHGFGTSIGGLDFNRTGLGPLIEDTVRVPHDDAEALERAIVELGADRVAAFFCEPVIGTGGVYFPEPGYLARVEEICRANDVLFVADEVITGFGRTGAMFASERFRIAPDVLLTAKGITSGYAPLGAAVVSEPLWAPFWDEDAGLIFHHGMTYSGHATACAVALANIDILEREGLVERVRSLEGPLAEAMAPLADLPAVKEVRTGAGLLAAIEPHDPALGPAVAEYCIEHGVLMRTITDGALQVSPPFVVEAEELKLTAEVVAAGFAHVGAEGA